MNRLTEIEESSILRKISEIRDNCLPKEYLDTKDKNAYQACLKSPFETLCYLELFINDFREVIEKNEKSINDVLEKTKNLLDKVNQEEKKQKYVFLGLFTVFIVFSTLFIVDILITIYSYWFLHKVI